MAIDVTYSLYIDWDKDGFGAGDEITDAFNGSIVLGITEPDGRLASVGELTLTLDNASRQYSPNYTSGPHYGKLVPGLPVKVEATISGVGTVQVCYMKTVEWRPHSQRYGDRTVELVCHDRMRDLIDNDSITLPLRQDITADALIKLILASTYKTDAASGTITLGSNPADGDTVTIDGITFTFKTAIASTGDILIGTDASATADNLTAAFNGDDGSGSLYVAATTTPRVIATASVGVITVYADARGSWGNSVALAKSSAAITLSGATLSGGADGPTGATFVFDTGTQTIQQAADTWQSDTLKNAMSAIEEVLDTEYGFFAFGRDGSAIFRNSNWLFNAANGSAVAIDNTQADFASRVSLDDISNRAEVTYKPRQQLTSGVIARAPTSIEVPPSGVVTKRWATWANTGTAETKTITLPFIDPSTGQPMGAIAVNPLVPGTHYSVTDFEDGSGFDYSTGGRLKVTWAINGGSLEITFSNGATGSLWVHDLYVEGIGLVTYNEQRIVREDVTSIASYGVRSRTHQLPLGVTSTWAETLADWLATADAEPHQESDIITFTGNLDTASSVHLMTLDLFDLIDVTEYQAAVASQRYAIVGWECEFASDAATSLTLHLRDVSDQTYWLLGVSGFSELGQTTRLGL